MYDPVSYPGSPGLVRTLEVFQDTLRVGGDFREAGGLQAYGLASWHMPEIPCNYMKPMVYSDTTTYYLIDDTAEVQFYNNNPYVESWQWDFGDSGTDNVRNPVHIYTDTGIYDVQVTVEHEGCIKTGTKTIVIDYPVNVPETKKEKNCLKLHPNPASDMLFVEIQGNVAGGETDIIISDINGNIIKRQKADSEKISIDISGFAKGSYIVAYGGCSGKFVKE